MDGSESWRELSRQSDDPSGSPLGKVGLSQKEQLHRLDLSKSRQRGPMMKATSCSLISQQIVMSRQYMSNAVMMNGRSFT